MADTWLLTSLLMKTHCSQRAIHVCCFCIEFGPTVIEYNQYEIKLHFPQLRVHAYLISNI